MAREEAANSAFGESAAGGRRDKAKSAAAEVAQEAAFDFANMLWRVLVIDVEATLKRAMHKVLNDHAVSEEARVRRARALRVLGNIFLSTCFAPRTTEIEVAAGSSSAVAAVAAAVAASRQKQQQQQQQQRRRRQQR